MTPPDSRERARVVRVALTVLIVSLVVGGLGWGAWTSSGPSVHDAIALAEAGRYDEAEAKARACLSRFHANDAVHLLLAQIVLKRASTSSSQAKDPALAAKSALVALNHLSQVRPNNPRMAVTFHVSRGNALDYLHRLDEAEAAWLEATQIRSADSEAGLSLLNLYYLLGRNEDARRLAQRLLPLQTDPHDRALLLLELVKSDARPPAPGSLVKLFEPVVLENPGDLQPALALGLALTRVGRADEGIDQLRRAIQIHPNRVEAREILLTALEESGQIDLMAEELERLPAPLSSSPRLIKHRARVAQGSRWPDAVALFRQARTVEPWNRVVEYRLSRALRHVGETAEADQIEQRIRRRDVAIQELRPLFDQAAATPDLGSRPHPDLCQRIADARERMQLPEEAIAWHRLVLRNDPKNEVSLAALARLGAEGASQ
jgi:tetratricopeptide (TPR) repeat protein